MVGASLSEPIQNWDNCHHQEGKIESTTSILVYLKISQNVVCPKVAVTCSRVGKIMTDQWIEWATHGYYIFRQTHLQKLCSTA